MRLTGVLSGIDENSIHEDVWGCDRNTKKRNTVASKNVRPTANFEQSNNSKSRSVLFQWYIIKQ